MISLGITAGMDFRLVDGFGIVLVIDDLALFFETLRVNASYGRVGRFGIYLTDNEFRRVNNWLSVQLFSNRVCCLRGGSSPRVMSIFELEGLE